MLAVITRATDLKHSTKEVSETMLSSSVLSYSLNNSKCVFTIICVFICVYVHVCDSNTSWKTSGHSQVKLHSAGFSWSTERAAVTEEVYLWRRRDYNQIRDYHTPTVSMATDRPIFHSRTNQLQLRLY